MRTIIERVRAEGIRGRRAPVDLRPAARTSPGADGVGEPEADEPWGFDDPLALIDLLGVDLLCITAGSPYYCPHAQRPAWTPAERRLRAARGSAGRRGPAARRRRRHRRRPARTSRSSPPGFSYLQEWLPHVASAMVRDGGAALVGIGRMALSYPDLPADVLAGRPLDRAPPVPHVQRLHHRAAQRPRVGLLSPRPVLQGAPRPTPPRPGQEARPCVSRGPHRVAVVGLGIGQMHVWSWRRMKDRFAIVAVADPDEARASDAAERTGAAIVTFEEAIERDDVDIVDLCTPPSLHLEQITAALAAGKHVVCEKPLVASLRDCDTLAEAEAASAGRLMPIFQYRFGNGLQKVKALVDRGVAGPAYTSSVEVAWRRRADYYAVPVARAGGRPSSAACSSARPSTPSTCSPTSPARPRRCSPASPPA